MVVKKGNVEGTEGHKALIGAPIQTPQPVWHRRPGFKFLATHLVLTFRQIPLGKGINPFLSLPPAL